MLNLLSSGQSPLDDSMVRMMADPWGGPTTQWADNGSTESIVLRSKHVHTFTATSGKYAAMINPSFNNSIGVYAITGDALGATATYTDHPDTMSYQNEFGAYRVLVVGVKLIYNGAEDAGAGRFAFLLGTNTDMASGTIDGNLDDAVYTGRSDEGPMGIIAPNGEPSYELTTSVTKHASTFPKAFLLLTGASAVSNAYTLEVTRVIEFEPKHSSLHRASAQAAHARMLACTCSTGMFVAAPSPFASGPDAQTTIRDSLRKGAATVLKKAGQEMLAAMAMAAGGPGAAALMRTVTG